MNQSATWPAWALMWLLAVTIYAICKLATWSARTVQAPVWKHIAYLVAWPGMDCDTFLAVPRTGIQLPSAGEWTGATVKLVAGAAVVWGLSPIMRQFGPEAFAWSGMIGLALILHFGLFHLLSCIWRSAGIDALPIMNFPLVSAGVSEFWGRRWNLAFRDLSHRWLFVPLRRSLTPTGALAVAFLASGIVHDLVISGPSRSGWGLPTLYFVLQFAGVMLEHGPIGVALGFGRLWMGRLYCWVLIVLPSPLLFHAAFTMRVIVPFLDALGVGTCTSNYQV